jgi:hypothetical protein
MTIHSVMCYQLLCEALLTEALFTKMRFSTLLHDSFALIASAASNTIHAYIARIEAMTIIVVPQ